MREGVLFSLLKNEPSCDTGFSLWPPQRCQRGQSFSAFRKDRVPSFCFILYHGAGRLAKIIIDWTRISDQVLFLCSWFDCTKTQKADLFSFQLQRKRAGQQKNNQNKQKQAKQAKQAVTVTDTVTGTVTVPVNKKPPDGTAPDGAAPPASSMQPARKWAAWKADVS